MKTKSKLKLKTKSKFLSQIVWIFFILILDFVLWIIIGLILLNYEDFYDESKGEYFSLASMTMVEKMAYISYYLWVIFNVAVIIYLIYFLVKKFIVN